MFDINPHEVQGMNTVSKERKPKSSRKQFGVRLERADVTRVADTAKGLGLDETSFLRMVILENLPRYERRVAQLREGNLPADE